MVRRFRNIFGRCVAPAYGRPRSAWVILQLIVERIKDVRVEGGAPGRFIVYDGVAKLDILDECARGLTQDEGNLVRVAVRAVRERIVEFIDERLDLPSDVLLVV